MGDCITDSICPLISSDLDDPSEQRVRQFPNGLHMSARRSWLILLALLLVPRAFAQGFRPFTTLERWDETLRPAQVRGDRTFLPTGAICRFGTDRFRLDSPVRAVSFFRNGKTLAARADSTRFSLWDFESGKELQHLIGVTGYGLSRDGQILAICCRDKVIHLHDASTGTENWNFAVKTKVARGAIAVAPDGSTLVWVDHHDGAIHVVDLTRRKEVRRLPVAGGIIRFIAYTPDGKGLVTDTQDGPDSSSKFRVLNASTGKEILRLDITLSTPSALALCPQGKYFAWGAADRGLRLCRLENGKEVRRLDDRVLCAVAFSPDGKVLAGADHAGRVRLWTVETGRELCHFLCQSGAIYTVAFSPDGKVLAVGGEGHSLRLFEVRTGKALPQGEGPAGAVWCVAISPDRSVVATAGWDGVIRLWDTSTGKRLRQLEGRGSTVSAVVFSPSGKRLASSALNGSLRVWNGLTGESVGSVSAMVGVRFDSLVIVSDDIVLAAGEGERAVWVMDAMTGKTLHRFPCEGAFASSVALSSDGRILASHNGDGLLRLWDLATGKLRRSIRLSVPTTIVVSNLVFSRDGRTLVCKDGQGHVKLFEVATGLERCRLQGGFEDVVSLAISPDGRLVASGRLDGTVGVSDAITGKLQGEIQGHKGSVCTLAFDATGKILVSGSTDTTALAWEVKSLRRQGTRPALPK
jgi:WD40 repeat protein